jgi:hypothetical protein
MVYSETKAQQYDIDIHIWIENYENETPKRRVTTQKLFRLTLKHLNLCLIGLTAAKMHSVLYVMFN